MTDKERVRDIARKICEHSIEYRQWGYESDSCGSYEYKGDADNDMWFLLSLIGDNFVGDKETTDQEIQDTEDKWWRALYKQDEKETTHGD